jgi:signal transduction histidine kinase
VDSRSAHIVVADDGAATANVMVHPQLAWSILELVGDPIWVVDDAGEVLWCNAAASSCLSGESEVVVSNIFAALPPDKAQHRRLMLNTVKRTGKAVNFVDHHESWWEVSINQIDGLFVFWQRNVDRRVVAEEDLRRTLSRAVTIQEDERRRISRDLHDETGQALTSLILELRELARQVPEPDLRNRTEQAAESVVNLMRQMRTLLYQLNPHSLKTTPLKDAMLDYCTVFSARTGIRVMFEAVEAPGRLPEEHSTTLYRLLQEGLTNVARHAEATTAWVSLSADEHEVTITVEDDGCGLTENGSGGSGLLGIRERFAMLDGHVEVEGAPGSGVRLGGAIPLKTPKTYEGRIT